MQISIHDISIHYTDEGKGPPLLFVHGFPLSKNSWKHQIEALRSEFRVIAPDLRGFGESEAGAGAATMEQFAEDLHALLKHLDTGPVVLIGHSMGGYIALAFARMFPQMLRGLVLVATRPGADTPEGAAKRRATAEKVRESGPQTVIDAMVPKMLSPKNQDPKLLESVRELMTRSSREGVIGALLGMAQRSDSSDVLAKISAPSLVITGADDVLIPAAESTKMAQAIPDAQVEILPQSGHLLFFEKPVEFNRLLKEWLADGRVRSLLP